MRCKRNHFLYHGTLLYDFRLDLIEICLAVPPRQPDYRAGRPHADFVANLPLGAMELRGALQSAFGGTAPLDPWPEARTRNLAHAKYATSDWTFRH